MSTITRDRSERPGRRRLPRRRAMAVSAVVMAGLQASTGLSAARADRQPAGAKLDWHLCASAAKEWPIKDDTRTECAELTVPLDYGKPEGRKITLAVSRVRASDPTARATPLAFVLGGPSFSNISDPASATRRGLGSLNTRHDFVGLDLRGTGYSDHVSCDSPQLPEPAPTTPEKDVLKAAFASQAEFNTRCAAADPDFVRQLTPENVARDIDRLRSALGSRKVNFYGASFGTAVGMAYRSLFDARTERMWLDSVMPPTRHWPTMDGATEAVGEEAVASFVAWLARHDATYRLGADETGVRRRLGTLRNDLDKEPRVSGDTRLDGNWVAGQVARPRDEWSDAARSLVAVLKGGAPPTEPTAEAPTARRRPVFGLGGPRSGPNYLQYNAVFCNADASSRDFEALWAAREARRRADPLTGGTQFSVWCADWPLDSPAVTPSRGDSALQLSGHLYEGVTPYAWAEQAKVATGGALLTVLDDGHASLPSSPCAEKAVTFFRTGRKAEGTCRSAAD
ncbi:alpha/beta fold hydrolase [Streptomyces sp. G45]|uniref:alpha/beta fold hydrolase n=1 Tax=Streptomyces sp. G45 TaxID=3406627 RepID=UPI003C1C55E7